MKASRTPAAERRTRRARVIGRKIEQLRTKLDDSQGELSECIGVSERTLQRWEVGKVLIPRRHFNAIVSYYNDGIASAAEKYDAEQGWNRLIEEADRNTTQSNDRAVGHVSLSARPWRGAVTTSELTDAQVLMPQFRGTRLVGRDKELASLLQWRDSPESLSIRLLVGETGIGKTRLAVEFLEDTRLSSPKWGLAILDQIIIERLRAASLEALTWANPLILLCDQAEIMGESLAILLNTLNQLCTRERPPIRILLLARQADPWYDQLSDYGKNDSLNTAPLHRVFHPPNPLRLGRLNFSDRVRLLETILVRGSRRPPHKLLSKQVRSRLKTSRFGSPLYIALIGVSAKQLGVGIAIRRTPIELANLVAEREADRYRSFAPPGTDAIHRELLPWLAGCVALQGGVTPDQLKQLVREELHALRLVWPSGERALERILEKALLPRQRSDMIRDYVAESIALYILTQRSKATSDEIRGDWAQVVARCAWRSPIGALATLIHMWLNFSNDSFNRDALEEGFLSLIRTFRSRPTFLGVITATRVPIQAARFAKIGGAAATQLYALLQKQKEKRRFLYPSKAMAFLPAVIDGMIRAGSPGTAMEASIDYVRLALSMEVRPRKKQDAVAVAFYTLAECVEKSRSRLERPQIDAILAVVRGTRHNRSAKISASIVSLMAELLQRIKDCRDKEQRAEICRFLFERYESIKPEPFTLCDPLWGDAMITAARLRYGWKDYPGAIEAASRGEIIFWYWATQDGQGFSQWRHAIRVLEKCVKYARDRDDEIRRIESILKCWTYHSLLSATVHTDIASQLPPGEQHLAAGIRVQATLRATEKMRDLVSLKDRDITADVVCGFHAAAQAFALAADWQDAAEMCKKGATLLKGNLKRRNSLLCQRLRSTYLEVCKGADQKPAVSVLRKLS